ncbi:MAG: dockerin type I domain-containing protein, partial [Balneolales bacterium]|nr:dockerin type I domain-containing protein [Balneolales bacterium]
SAMISHSGSGVLPYASPFITFQNHSARFYEISPSINAIQNMAVGILRDHPGIGLGVIGFDHNATVYTTIINDDSRTDFDGLFTDWPWSSIEKAGIVIANTSALSGSAQIVVSSDDESSFYKYGDVNRDTKVNSADAEFILNNVVSTPGSTANGLSSFLDKGISDVSGDGTVTSYDAALIFSKSTGSISVFPSDQNENGYFPQADWFRSASDNDIPLAASRVLVANDSEIIADYFTSSSPEDDTLRVVLNLYQRSSHSSVFMEVDFDTSLVALDRVILPSLSKHDQITRSFTTSTGVRVGAIGRTSDISGAIVEMLFVPKEDTTVSIGFPLILLDETYSFTSTESIVVSVKPKEGVGIDHPGFGEHPVTVALLANYPNPFNPTTTIPFELDTPYFVEIDILDVTGRLVSRLTQDNYASGRHSVTFNGTGLASGVYLVRIHAIDRSLNTTSHQLIRKITLIK